MVVERGDGFNIIYLDFAKAVDKVPRERLLKKIRAHGSRGKVLDLIKKSLTGRQGCRSRSQGFWLEPEPKFSPSSSSYSYSTVSVIEPEPAGAGLFSWSRSR